MKTLQHFKSLALRSEATLRQDAIGAFALFALLMSGLFLPALI